MRYSYVFCRNFMFIPLFRFLINSFIVPLPVSSHWYYPSFYLHSRFFEDRLFVYSFSSTKFTHMIIFPSLNEYRRIFLSRVYVSWLLHYATNHDVLTTKLKNSIAMEEHCNNERISSVPCQRIISYVSLSWVELENLSLEILYLPCSVLFCFVHAFICVQINSSH